MNVVDHIRERAAEAPERPALVSDGPGGHAATLGYAELLERVDCPRGTLPNPTVIRVGDRCGLLAPQGATFVELALGILAAGGCVVPVSEDHKGPAFDAFAGRARLHSVVVAAAGGAEFRRLPDPGAHDGAGTPSFERSAPAYLRFTSGTTHRRKGVILGHDAILARLAAANRALAIGPDDRVMWLLPMAHHFVVSILLYLRYGATILLPHGSLARRYPRVCAARTRDGLLRVSVPLPRARQGRVRHRTRFVAPRRVDCGRPAARRRRAIPRALRPARRAGSRHHRGRAACREFECAGAKARLARTSAARLRSLAARRGRAPVAGPTSAERTGEICIRGPGMLDAYLDPWLPAAAVLEPDGFRTGDQGWFDADGDLRMAGRRSSRISMAGMKFFGEEVEAVIDAHHRRARVSRVPTGAPASRRDPRGRGRARGPARATGRRRTWWHTVASRFRALQGSAQVSWSSMASMTRTVTGKLQRHAKSGAVREALPQVRHRGRGSQRSARAQ